MNFATAIVDERDKTPTPMESLFIFVPTAMLLGYICYVETINVIYIGVVSAISAAICVYLTIYTFRKKCINIIRFIVYQNILWYFFPLAYYGAIDTTGMFRVSEPVMMGVVPLIVVILSIGWALSFLIPSRITFSVNQPAFISRTELWGLIIPFMAFQVILMAAGVWSYDALHATALDVRDNTTGTSGSAFRLFAMNIAPGIGVAVAYNYGLLAPKQRTRFEHILFAGVICLQLVFWLMAGRRTMMTMMTLGVLAFAVARFPNRFTPSQLARIVIVLCLSLVVLISLNKVFYTMRVAITKLESHHSLSISEMMVAMQQVPAAEVDSEMAYNLASRPFIIESVAIGSYYHTDYAYGAGLLASFMWTIPSAIFTNKTEYMSHRENAGGEVMWAAALSVPYSDYANSLLLDGYMDFGYFGFIIYVIVVILMFSAVRMQLRWQNNALLYYITTFAFLFNMAQTELSLSGVISNLRDCLLLSIVVLITSTIFTLYKKTWPYRTKFERLKALRAERSAPQNPLGNG